MEGEPLDEVQWRAPEYIQAFGLRTDNVLDYFAQSPFYDRSSNNQVLKMQSQFNDNFYGRQDLYSELKNMKGIEFVIVLAREPDLWIIRKQQRLSPMEVRLKATYFVVGGNIYQAPSVYSIVSSRLLSTTLNLSKALDIAASLPSFSPSQGYSYLDEHNTIAGLDESASGANSASATPIAAKKTPRNTGLLSNYNSPMPGSSAAATPAAGGESNNNTSIIADQLLREREHDRSIEYALAFTMNNQAVYLDDEKSREFGALPGMDKRKAQASKSRLPRKAK